MQRWRFPLARHLVCLWCYHHHRCHICSRFPPIPRPTHRPVHSRPCARMAGCALQAVRKSAREILPLPHFVAALTHVHIWNISKYGSGVLCLEIKPVLTYDAYTHNEANLHTVPPTPRDTQCMAQCRRCPRAPPSELDDLQTIHTLPHQQAVEQRRHALALPEIQWRVQITVGSTNLRTHTLFEP